MITRLTLRNFKSIGEQAYDFGPFDLLVGRNNSGKSTVLQALAIWQFCLDEFCRSKRSGSKGIQVILPNFTVLPLPEFNLLWKDKTDRLYPKVDGNRKQQFVLIEIFVAWIDQKTGQSHSFGISLRYHSPQAIYAKPADGWEAFRQLEAEQALPRIVYVPPFSGLEPTEERRDDAPVRQQVGKAQPGSVLRNLLWRVCLPSPLENNGKLSKSDSSDWSEIQKAVEAWFSVTLLKPKYDPDKDVLIQVEYQQKNKKVFDIIAGGSGFHQALTLLAFFYGYKPSTILLDEPDAHLHANLQREMLHYFKWKSAENNVQFLIATHAEEFINAVDTSQIVSLLSQKPLKVESKPQIVRALADVANTEITSLQDSPYMLYVEGSSDERILRAWAATCGMNEVLEKFTVKTMQGGSKATMKESAELHFKALRQIVPTARRVMLFDYDSADKAFHPQADNPNLFEWKRRNIENYLLVPESWNRSIQIQPGYLPDSLFEQPPYLVVENFFAEQNLTLPKGKTWRNVNANVFQVVDGKGILFEKDDSLFQRLRACSPPVELIRERVAASMKADEIHDDIYQFFDKLYSLTGNAQ